MDSGFKSFIRYMLCKHFYLIFGLPFDFVNCTFQREVFNFDEVQFTKFVCVCVCALLVWYLRSLCFIQGHKDFVMCFLPEFL